MGTSVCNSRLGCGPLRVSVRRALTTPDVTVWVNPSGAPMANRRMPGLRLSESPSAATTGFFGGVSALRSARSSVRDRVTICATEVGASLNSTSMRSASSTTCAAVTIHPSGCTMTPEPVPVVIETDLPPEPSEVRFSATRTVTTEPSTR